jgi:NTP pyrophosphatase (non-canonical NTP hydrolase)
MVINKGLEPTTLRRGIYADITEERYSQDMKWGIQRQHSDLKWNAILGEEVGEASRAILEKDDKNLEEELIQCAAVIVCWLEAIRFNKENN